jgi:hypothetical protein
MTYKMIMKESITLSSARSRRGQDPSREPSPGPGLCVTVISTTPEGTTAALDAARRLGEDLNTQITLLTFEVVRFDLPLEQPPLVLDCNTEQRNLLVPRLCAHGEQVNVRICLCHDLEGDLQRVLRRRALVLIGGKRHWWSTSEERLERALRRLGHHVIFVDAGQKAGRAGQGAFRRSPGSDASRFDEQVGAAL